MKITTIFLQKLYKKNAQREFTLNSEYQYFYNYGVRYTVQYIGFK